MSDPATRVERVQRRLRHHLQCHPTSPLRVLARPMLDTRARRERAGLCNPRCPCADVGPACREWMGIDGEGDDQRCPRCGAPRSYHDDQARKGQR